MKFNILLTIITFALLIATGCTHVGSAAHTDSTLTGDAWYVNEVRFAGNVWKTRVMYCPKPKGRGHAPCFEAKMHEASVAAAPAAAPPAAQPAAQPMAPPAQGQAPPPTPF